MHEFPRNQPAVRPKWMKFIQFKRADFLAAPHHAHLCSEHFSECDFANAMEYCMGFASKRNLKHAAFPSMQKGGTFSTTTINTAVPVPSLKLLPLRPPIKCWDRLFWQFCCWHDVQVLFKILPDRLKLIWLYPCGSLGQNISFIFGAWVHHFTATPQSDVVRIWAHDLGVMATLSIRQKMPFFMHL